MTTPRFHPPQQLRSQATLDRILDASESVLEDKSFSDATLAEIMERAGVTVGAFYRRFPHKDALLHVMDERLFRELRQRGEEVLDPSRASDASVEEIIHEFIRESVAIYRARRGLLRSLVFRARVDPVLQESARQVNEHLVKCLGALLRARSIEINHPSPDRAIEMGYMVLVGALREATLFSDVWPEPHPLNHDDLALELARVLTSYLALGGAAADRSPVTGS
jgi:AcrR family transcriptional regulator